MLILYNSRAMLSAYAAVFSFRCCQSDAPDAAAADDTSLIYGTRATTLV